MNYLFRYLSMMKPAEVERLRELDMAPREREVLDLLTTLRLDPETTKQDAIRRLAMSGSMFDKTCSVLLRTILRDAVPQGGGGLLEHLVRHGVYDLFLHELRRQEKECRDGDDREEQLRFYADAFRVLHMNFSSDYPERLARRIAAAYRRLNPSPDTDIYVEACLTRMAVWVEASRRTGDDTLRRLKQRLARNQARITADTGVMARYGQLRAWITYYGQLKRDPEKRMACLRDAAELCERHPELLACEEKVHTLCNIAEEHYFYHTDLVTPLNMYRDLFARYPGEMKKMAYHAYKFIQLCMINGEYEDARSTLVEFFGTEANLVVHAGGRSKDIALLWTKLMLLTDRFDEARQHLDTAVLLNQKGFFLQYEVECRMLHTALAFMEGDFDLVERRLPSHIQYLRSKGITYKTSRYYPWFFKLAGAFIDERTLGRKLSPQLEHKLEEFMEGAAAQYGVLLRKMRTYRLQG